MSVTEPELSKDCVSTKEKCAGYAKGKPRETQGNPGKPRAVSQPRETQGNQGDL